MPVLTNSFGEKISLCASIQHCKPVNIWRICLIFLLVSSQCFPDCGLLCRALSMCCSEAWWLHHWANSDGIYATRHILEGCHWWWIINENGVCQHTAFSAKQLTLSQVMSMIFMQFAKQIAKKTSPTNINYPYKITLSIWLKTKLLLLWFPRLIYLEKPTSALQVCKSPLFFFPLLIFWRSREDNIWDFKGLCSWGSKVVFLPMVWTLNVSSYTLR